MKLISAELGQVTWIVDLSIARGDLYIPEALANLNARYSFVKSPDVMHLLNAGASVTFEHGKFNNFVIRKFSLHSDGMIAESQAGTEVAENFLEDFLSWSKDEFGVTKLDINESYKVYDSHLVAQMKIDLPENMMFVRTIASHIQTILKGYEIKVPDYQVSGFSLCPDSEGITGLAPSPFHIERRTKQPFSKNLFFSTAPLQTNDHAELLEIIEKTI